MFPDSPSGDFGFTPDQLKRIAKIDPLFLKMVQSPEQMTAAEKEEAMLRAVSMVLNLVPTKELKELDSELSRVAHDSADLTPDQKSAAIAVTQMVSGKVALREMGLLQQSKPHLWAWADLLDKAEQKEKRLRAAKARRRAAAKKKKQSTAAKAKKKPATAKSKPKKPVAKSSTKRRPRR